jgi:radical SAM protein with 4Fe4S-binding SPASM domain
MRYDERPFIAIWEITQACDLACVHCRACARPERDHGELTTAEGFALLERFAAARVPLVVLTGGDPAKRPDLLQLVAHGSACGLHMGLTPSATELVTTDLISGLASARLKRLAVSIDGPEAVTHDEFRGVEGSFDHALRILREARAAGLSTQVNTTVHAKSIDRLREMADLVAQLGSVLWSVFYVVPTGRAELGMLPSAEAVEASLEELSHIAAMAPFAVKTTAAPHYRRVLLERQKTGGAPRHGIYGKDADRINDGRGFLFVSHRGAIYPSGFLPIDCGNVRESNPIDVYRGHPVFRDLREANLLTGKCAACEYRRVCGGSRARAYAVEGSMHASDPLCAYVPPGYVPRPGEARRRLSVLA